MSINSSSVITSSVTASPVIPPPPVVADRDLHPADPAEPVEVAAQITVRPWIDPVVDDRGHDPRSVYVESFWLSVLGPTATWLLRRLASGLEAEPDGFELDLGVTASSMGLKFSAGRSSPFSRALQRCVMFGMAHPLPDGGLAVRRRVPPVGHRHLRRMPEDVQLAHARWQADRVDADPFVRAHHLAMAMLEVGDDRAVVEHQLRALGVAPATAAEVADNVARLA